MVAIVGGDRQSHRAARVEGVESEISLSIRSRVVARPANVSSAAAGDGAAAFLAACRPHAITREPRSGSDEDGRRANPRPARHAANEVAVMPCCRAA